jgi:hypothetical protein
MEMLSYVMQQLPVIIPMLLVYLVGAGISMTRLEQLGKPAALALAGCWLLAAITLLFPFLQGFIIVNRQGGIAPFGLWLRAIGVVRSLLYAMGFALVLAAVFADRRTPASAQKVPDERDRLLE